MPGPKIRSDIVDVYVFRLPGLTSPDAPLPASAAELELLQLRRRREPMAGTWQPVMGHIEEGETAAQAAVRELQEETGYATGSDSPGSQRSLLHLWQLEGVNTYYLASLDEIMMSPCFAALVRSDLEPVMDDSHDQYRWVKQDAAERDFAWPGQRRAIAELLREILQPGAVMANSLKINV